MSDPQMIRATFTDENGGCVEILIHGILNEGHVVSMHLAPDQAEGFARKVLEAAAIAYRWREALRG